MMPCQTGGGMRWWTAVLAVVVTRCGDGPAETSRSPLINRNNTYDLLVAVSDSVDEANATSIIQGLEEYFKDASSELFQATKSAFRLDKITILLPSKWNVTSRDVIPAITETYERANVIVDKPNLDYGDNPYTKQVAGCAQRGEYIHLTPRYIYDTNNTAKRISKNIGRAIAHELGHLLWGLYNEYPLPGQPKFYLNSKGVIQPVGCTANISGRVSYKGSVETCIQSESKYIDNSTGLFIKECVFIPDDAENATLASIMNIHYIGKVNEFCGISGEDHGQHNSEAPNLQNRLCEGRSAKDVIFDVEGYADSAQGNSQTIIGIETSSTPKQPQIWPENLIPTFLYTQVKGNRRLVLALNVNGNLTEEVQVTVKNALSDYIENLLEENTDLAVIRATENSSVNFSSVDNMSRRQLAEDIRSTVFLGDDTCIECRIEEADKLLVSGEGPKGILLISTAAGSATIRDWSRTTTIDGRIISVISLGDKFNRDLRKAANFLGASFRHVKTNPKNMNRTKKKLAGALLNAESRQRRHSNIQQIFSKENQMVSKRNKTTVESKRSGSFVLDSSLIGGTHVIFTADVPGNVSVSLTFPSNTTSHRGLSPLKIPLTEKGTWGYVIDTCDGCSSVGVAVIASSSRNADVTNAITVTATVSVTEVDFNSKDKKGRPPQLSVFATVQEGLNPVLNATVFAEIDDGDTTTTQRLYDNGAGADILADDGTYSAYLVTFTGNGAYDVNVRLDNTEGTAQIKSRSTPHSGAFSVEYLDSSGDVIDTLSYSSIDPMTRINSAGGFDVANYDPNVDYYPPSRITDLHYRVVWRDRMVVLKWTAVGDDLDKGQASSYLIHHDTDASRLRSNFNTATPLTDNDVRIGNLSQPASSGEPEVIIVHLPHAKDGHVYVFGVKAIDDMGKTSELSNLIHVAFINPQKDVTLTPDTETPPATSGGINTGTQHSTVVYTSTTAKSNQKYDREVFINISIYVPLGTVVLIVIIIIVSVIYCRKRPRSSKGPTNEPEMEDGRTAATSTQRQVKNPRRYIKAIGRRISLKNRASGIYASRIKQGTDTANPDILSDPARSGFNSRASGSYAHSIQPVPEEHPPLRTNFRNISTYKPTIENDYVMENDDTMTSWQRHDLHSSPDQFAVRTNHHYQQSHEPPPLPVKKKKDDNYKAHNYF